MRKNQIKFSFVIFMNKSNLLRPSLHHRLYIDLIFVELLERTQPFFHFLYKVNLIRKFSSLNRVLSYARYLIIGYSPSVEQSVAICSAITSRCAARFGGGVGLYVIKNVSGESSVNA